VFPGVAVLLLAVACGGDTTNGSAAASCAAVSGCGGDVTGLWHVTSMCANAGLDFFNSLDGGTTLPEACAAVLGGAEYEPVDATLSFTADGNYVEVGNVRFVSAPLVDTGCLSALGVTDVASFCSSLDASYKQNFDTASCASTGGGCQCSVSKLEPFSGAGSYRAQGTNLSFDASSVQSPYCVTGSTAAVSLSTAGFSAVMQLAR